MDSSLSCISKKHRICEDHTGMTKVWKTVEQCQVWLLQDGEAASSINHPDPEMTLVDIPEDFLEKIYLGRCAYDFNYACSSPESQYTDLNIWDKFLSTEKLMQWTTCQ